MMYNETLPGESGDILLDEILLSEHYSVCSDVVETLGGNNICQSSGPSRIRHFVNLSIRIERMK